jgi:hypothetical protein
MSPNRTSAVVVAFAFVALVLMGAGLDLGLWICVGGMAGAVVRHNAG